MQTLAQVPVGERTQVRCVDGSDRISQRLLEMGLTPGAEVVVVGTAPLGDPVELLIRGYRLSVRRREAERVQVGPGA